MDIIYPNGNKVPEKVNDKNDDDRCDSSSSNKSEDSLDDDNSQVSDLLYKTKNGTKYKKRKVPRIIRFVKYNKKKDPENYFREQLMLFVPLRNEQKDLLCSFDTYCNPLSLAFASLKYRQDCRPSRTIMHKTLVLCTRLLFKYAVSR